MPFIIKHELIHLFTVIPVSLFALIIYKKIYLVILPFLLVLLLDIDHLVDYIYFQGLNFSINPLSGKYFSLSQKVIVPLHSWEILLIFLFIFIIFKKPIFLIILLTYLSHLLVDQFTYQTNPLSYFLIYRLSNNFSLNSFKNLSL